MRPAILILFLAASISADTVYDGQMRRYGCVRDIDAAGLTLEVKCDAGNTVRISFAAIRYIEFNETIEGFAAAGILRSQCGPCSCPQPSQYLLIEFTKGAGTIYASSVILHGGRFRFQNASDGAWYSGPAEKVFSVLRYFDCPTEAGKSEVPSSFQKE